MESPGSSIVLLFIGILITFGVFLVFLFLIFFNRKNKLIQQNLEETLSNQQQRHALELQALRSQMNPHFVHNSLNAIQYYIQRNEVELSEMYLTKFSKLIRSFFELSRKQTITIEQESELLENYLAIEQLRFEDKLDYKISIDERIDEDTMIPTMLLQPIVENAINHGVFHKKGAGFVEVQFDYISEDCYRVTIKDDGIGLKKGKAIFDQSAKKIGNRSSAVLDDRLKLLAYSNTWRIDYTLKEREDTQGTVAQLVFNIANVV